MLHSLRVRLLLTMSIVVLVAVGTIAFFTSNSTSSEFRRYVENDIARNRRLVYDLFTSYKGDRSPENLQRLVDGLADTSGERLVVADSTGQVLADSGGIMVGEHLEWPAQWSSLFFDRHLAIPGEPGVGVTSTLAFPISGTLPLPITSAIGLTADARERPIWSPIFIPLAQVPEDTSGEGRLIVARVPNNQGGPGGGNFLGSVNRSLILAVVAAGLVAILLTWLLSRRILRPVEALTVAARNMEKGDLSKRVEVSSKDEIGELAHAFNAMADGLTHLEQLRRNMVTDVAHELRTPLSNIRGYLEAMRDGVAKPNPALINSLHEEALLLSRLVDDLQELELAEAGQLKLVKQPVEIKEVIEKAVHAVQPLALGRELHLQVDVPDLPLIEADPERIGQVLRNLLNNAITHTSSGGEVTIVARNDGPQVEVSVRDTGVGIPPEHLSSVFERFYRADGSRARTTGGAGLGLSIVKHLVELHGGHVRAESIAGEGSTFSFTLPVTWLQPNIAVTNSKVEGMKHDNSAVQ